MVQEHSPQSSGILAEKPYEAIVIAAAGHRPRRNAAVHWPLNTVTRLHWLRVTFCIISAPTEYQGADEMHVEQVEIYSDVSNAAVMRHPGRRFPGVLVQGDTLYTLCS